MKTRATDLLRTLVFLAVLAGPLAVAGLGLDPAGGAAHENRTPAALPGAASLFSAPPAPPRGRGAQAQTGHSGMGRVQGVPDGGQEIPEVRGLGQITAVVAEIYAA